MTGYSVIVDGLLIASGKWQSFADAIAYVDTIKEWEYVVLVAPFGSKHEFTKEQWVCGK